MDSSLLGAKKRTSTITRIVPRFIAERSPNETQGYLKTIHYRLNKYILPLLGTCPLKEITSPHILQLCRDVESTGHEETAKRVKMIIGQIFRFSIASGWTEIDPTNALKGALMPRIYRHYPILTDPADIALLPAEKMKMKRRHIVPLSRQVHGVLDELRPLTGAGKWFFPTPRNNGHRMSENGVRVALRTIGFTKEQITPHSFRAMFSTIANENGFNPDAIEIIETISTKTQYTKRSI